MDQQTIYSHLLRDKIRLLFENMVIPVNVVSVFHKYSKKVLTERDISAVRAKTTNAGNHEGAAYLLSCLVYYEDWFPCLLKVLRDPDVNLGHVAEKFERISANLKLEDDGDKKTDEDSVERNPSSTHSGPSSPPLPMTAQPQSDFKLLERDNTPTNVVRPALPTPEENIVADAAPDSEYLDICDPSYEEPQRLTSNLDTGRKSVTSNKPERNFTKKEAISAMNSIPGFHPDITEKDIFAKLKPHRHEDGHYILWYWEDKRRPALCVTHQGEIKTLLVHKKPDPHDKTKVSFYFINKNEHRDRNLKELLTKHINDGVRDMTQTVKKVTINFDAPVKL